MKAANALALLLPAVAARFVDSHNGENVQLHPEVAAAEQFLIELGPGETRWVTEEEKWELKRNGLRFMDITETEQLGAINTVKVNAAGKTRVFPANATLQSEVAPLAKHLDKASLQAHLEKLTSFHTRYYKSDYGRQSSEWLLGQVKKIVGAAGGFQSQSGITVEHFPHPWGQNSIIARIPGQTNRTIVVGAHQDSINLFLPSILAAPGSDDDGSGTVTILEALTALLQSEDIKAGKAPNTVEFHWYSAEEGGLLGSQAIFSAYEKAGHDVRAMLQQDMTGYAQGTLDAGQVESVGVIVDYVDPALTEFIKKVIVAYCDIPFVETKCGYACSDHASASKAGYPSAFVIESSFELSDKHIHSTDDLIKYLSFDHMLQHARMTLGFVYELAFADFDKLEKSAGVDGAKTPAMGEL
ncbi:bacterial leucyl aminopeptidase [Sporothrix schenckii 1099-18]|uniref:Peptide hydrolase n=1 Tax=Sporothrix schenckii 1099-18 TaxID=1397361 RepID=A0A0F2M6E5_SPOSC|nr:bacterial leucyl aminopeptidase [Sporothrix schenckii 1099-18]KJR84375.1 bacterial leucyl aminopeptidase [Sporothrix schenckii 1099-18]